VLLIYVIGREVYGRAVALVAVILALASPIVLSMSGSLLSQSATWLFCGLFAYLLILWARSTPGLDRFSWGAQGGNAGLLVGAGLAVGMAFATRQLDSLTLGLPFLILLARRPQAVLWVGAGAALPVGLLAVYNQAVTGSVTGNGYAQAFSWDRFGFGPGVGGPTVYERDFTFARGIWNFAYDLEHLQGGLFGWPFFVALAVIGIPFLVGRANRWDWLLLASTVLVMSAYMAYWASGVTGGLPLYWYVVVPWLTLLAVWGFEDLAHWPERALNLRRPSSIAAVVFPAFLLSAMMAFDVADYLPANVLSYVNPQGPVVAAVRRDHLHDAVIFQVQHSRQDSAFDDVFSENSPLLMDANVVWAIDRGAEALERGGGDVGQPLPGAHQVEIAVRADREQLKHLVQHLPVLRGHADQRRDARGFRQARDDVVHQHRAGLVVRRFDDDAGVMNRSVRDSGGEILAVSQFTLHASTKKGARPSYSAAASPEVAQPLFQAFVGALERELGRQVPTGVFGAHMQIALTNDGPVTLWIDSETRE